MGSTCQIRIVPLSAEEDRHSPRQWSLSYGMQGLLGSFMWYINMVFNSRLRLSTAW